MDGRPKKCARDGEGVVVLACCVRSCNVEGAGRRLFVNALLGALETALLYVHKSSVFKFNAGALRTHEGVPRLARASSIPAS